MAKIESSFRNMVVSLTAITLLSGAALGYVHSLTKGPIAATELQKQEMAIQEVVLPFDNDPVAEQYRITADDGTETIVFPVKKEGKWIGAAVRSTKNGFGGPIAVMVGFDADGAIHNYRVLSHNETPGLGSKMEAWFRTEPQAGAEAAEKSGPLAFLHLDRWLYRTDGAAKQQSILSKRPGSDNLTVSKEGGSVDGITAATISSKAFLNAVQQAYAAFRGDAESGATTGATSKNKEEIR